MNNNINNNMVTNATNMNSMPINQNNTVKSKGKKTFTFLLVLIILLLSAFIYYSNINHQKEVQTLINDCSPVSKDKETELDVKSDLVKMLYNKVKTTMFEDYASTAFDNDMKLYLAYRQILEKDKYDSNCNLFDINKMEPFICEMTTSFSPKAFKIETLELEIKKLFGDNSNIYLDNIQLSNSCIGGYQYIPDRGEFVQGKCIQQQANSFRVTKKIISATTTRDKIILVEEVKYIGNDKMNLPSYLQSGNYIYTFKLDMNYQYILVNKEYHNKY